MTYVWLKTLTPGLIGVTSSGHGRQLFTRRKLRKAKACETCRVSIPAGAMAFGDVTSAAMNRAHRVHPECIVGFEPTE